MRAYFMANIRDVTYLYLMFFHRERFHKSTINRYPSLANKLFDRETRREAREGAIQLRVK